MKKTAAFLSLGCKVNSYETEAMRGMFENAGYDIVDFKDRADVYVVNTCTVTNIADRKSRQMLHQAKKRNPDAVIAAVGCYVQAAEEVLLEDSAVDLVVGNNKKSDIVQMVERCRSSQRKEELVIDIASEQEYEEMNILTTMEKTRAVVKIQDGCNRFCSYCIIPYVRGRVRSRKEAEIIAEITELVKKGYQEVVLTGIHISSYGTDRDHSTDKAHGMDKGHGIDKTHDMDYDTDRDHDIEQEQKEADMPLASLIKSISQIPGVERIRLGSLEPRIITEEFLQVISGIPQFCPHFHLSLQSGSDSVLRRMNRKYTAQEYLDRVRLIKKYFDLPAFTTDVIVGFPGETPEEYAETLDFVGKVGFSHIHVFKYSKRAGTKAAQMPDQVSEEIKSRRSDELITGAEVMAKEYKANFLGRIEKVLFEEEIQVEGRTYQVGHNERYLKLALESKEDLSNQMKSVRICGDLTEEIMLCEIFN
ncbi:MAG TPA: MiaB/RimO family radical SAM methylthiotransferase [Clostridiales bacterium]|nr:MiaB/RimO family radical SAM methylthiotransferase [Clostridiales bacterium]